MESLMLTGDKNLPTHQGAFHTLLECAVNPRLVYASISGFGQDGPYSKRPGFDSIAQGMGGLMSVTGKPGEEPMRVGIPIADLCAGHFCAMGVLAALLEHVLVHPEDNSHDALLARARDEAA